MNGDHTVMVEILNAIEHGNLSVHETRRRLEELIDIEIERADAPANMRLVEECEKLLWELNTNGQMPFISRMEENKAAVVKRAGKQKTSLTIRKNALRVAAVAAALFILVIGAEALLHREWMDSQPTEDEQQQVVEGEVVDPGLMREGVASDNEQSDEFLTTTNMAEAIAFVGMDFHIPETLEGDWNLIHIDCTRTKRKVILTSQFNHSSAPQNKLTISVQRFNSVEDTYLSFEQSKLGSTVNLNGIELYLSMNNERTRCSWMEDTCVYSIDGQLEHAEALKIAEQIIGDL